jgi:hypothetical protein
MLQLPKMNSAIVALTLLLITTGAKNLRSFQSGGTLVDLVTGTVFSDGKSVSKTILPNINPQECKPIAPTGSGRDYVKCCNDHRDAWHSYRWGFWYVDPNTTSKTIISTPNPGDYETFSTCDGFLTFLSLKSSKQGKITRNHALSTTVIGTVTETSEGKVEAVARPPIEFTYYVPPLRRRRKLNCKDAEGEFVMFPCHVDKTYCDHLSTDKSSRVQAYDSFTDANKGKKMPAEVFKLNILDMQYKQCLAADWNGVLAEDLILTQSTKKACFNTGIHSGFALPTLIEPTPTKVSTTMIVPNSAKTLSSSVIEGCELHAASARVYYYAPANQPKLDVCGTMSIRDKKVPWLYAGLESNIIVNTNGTLPNQLSNPFKEKHIRRQNFTITGTAWNVQDVCDDDNLLGFVTEVRKLYKTKVEMAMDKVYVHFDNLEHRKRVYTEFYLEGGITSTTTEGWESSRFITSVYNTAIFLALNTAEVSSYRGDVAVQFDFDDLSFPYDIGRDIDVDRSIKYEDRNGDQSTEKFPKDIITEEQYEPLLVLPSQLLQVHPKFRSCTLGWGKFSRLNTRVKINR